MGFKPFEVNVPHLAYTILGGFVVIFGMFSLVIKEKAYIGEAPIATVIGIIAGPYVTGLFDPSSWGGASSSVKDEITLEVTRVIIAISVFAVGVELPKAYMWRHWRTLFFLLGPCMLWGWMISALLMYALIPGVTFLSSLVIAAAVTPTDPILAQAVIGGRFADKHVPAHVRHMLSAESGSNDGAAFPFLGIALYLTLDASDGHAVAEWFYYTIAYEVILGIIIGSLLGWGARKVMKFSEDKRLIDRQSYVAQYVSLAVLSIGVTSLLGSDDLLSAFACGCAFAWDGFFNQATEDAVFSNVIDLLFNCAAFIYIGAIIPFDQFNNPALTIAWWRLVILAICILIARRLPSVLALYRFIPDIKTFREALFVGWFGPMGVGAIFISTLAKASLPAGDPEKNTEQVDLLRELLLPVTSFLVLSSIITHGLSIPFFSLSRRVHSLTYTWSRAQSMDARRDDEPAWTTHARRIIPGQEVVINRDDDEEGDIGMRQNGYKPEGREDSGGSSSSRTARNDSDEVEMTEQENQEKTHGGEQRHGGDSRRADGEEDGGATTPPLAEYREGRHLIVERKHGDGDEVDVEVIRNAFGKDHERQVSSFQHPRRLRDTDIGHLTRQLTESLEQPRLALESEAGSSRGDDVGSTHSSDRGDRTPSPFIHLPEDRKPGFRERWFGRREEPADDNQLSPLPRSSTSRPVPISSPSAESSRNLQMSRTMSIPRNTAIRFAEGSQPSSDSAPGPGNYGNTRPGFAPNPSLSLFRSSSIASAKSDSEPAFKDVRKRS